MIPILVADKDEKLRQAALVTWGAIPESNFRLKSVVMAWGVQREVSQFSASVVFNTETWSLVEPYVNSAAATRLKSLHAKQEAAAQQVQFDLSDPSIRVVGSAGAAAAGAGAGVVVVVVVERRQEGQGRRGGRRGQALSSSC